MEDVNVVVEKTCRVLVKVKASTIMVIPPLLFMDDSSSDKDSIWSSRMILMKPIDIVILILGIIVMICFMGEEWVID